MKTMKRALAPMLALAAAAAGQAFGQCALQEIDARIKLDAPGAMHDVGSAWVSRDAATPPRCILGAPGDDFGAVCCFNFGSAYVFEQDAGSGAWLTHYLTASDFDVSDHFGSAVAIHGDTAFIGADHAEGPLANCGEVYVFERGPSGWSETQRLTASDPGMHIHFGASIALADGVAVVGATKANQPTTATDAAYVFERRSGAWVETARLVGSDAGPSDSFAYALALSEDGATILVGAYRHPFPSSEGAVYVFERRGSAWLETAKLTARDARRLERFGTSVAISGSTALVGCTPDPSAGGAAASAAYVFERADGVWIETAKLASPSATDGEYFGQVSLDGGLALIGAPASGFTSDPVRGSAFVFERKDPGSPRSPLDDVWIAQGELAYAPAGADVEFVGEAVSLGKGLLLSSARISTASGFAYVHAAADLKTEAALDATPAALSVAAGGTQTLALRTCPALAGSLYLVLGSMSGTSPGIAHPAGVLPLNPDAYFWLSIEHPGRLIEGSFDAFDTSGESTAWFKLPLGLSPALAGIVLHHAFVAFSPATGAVQAFSNPEALALLP